MLYLYVDVTNWFFISSVKKYSDFLKGECYILVPELGRIDVSLIEIR
jgi:hypothetical protein